MTRVRDYAAEYARRTREARAQAEKTGQRLDLKAARGHGGKGSKPPKPSAKPVSGGTVSQPGPFKAQLLRTSILTDLPDVPKPLRKGGRKLKPIDQLSAPVRKRYEAYAGKHGVSLDESRQRARGHRPGESRRRQETRTRTSFTGELTRGQKSYLRAFFNREIVARHGDWDEDGDDLADEWQRFLGQSTLAGWNESLRRMRIQTQMVNARKKHGQKAIRALGYHKADLEHWGNAGADDGWDWTWFWYN